MHQKQRVRQQRHRLQVRQKRQQLEPKRGQEPVWALVPVQMLQEAVAVGGEVQFH